MKILGIETSCDETAISILTINSNRTEHDGTVDSHVVHSQIELHKEYGGVYPTLAKRDHIENIMLVLKESLLRAGLLIKRVEPITCTDKDFIQSITEMEQGLASYIILFFETYETPEIDVISITNGPGLTPALWVGVNTAKCLSVLWNVPIIPTNHMMGHLLSPFIYGDKILVPNIRNNSLGILLSGGHTEITLMDSLTKYTTIGQTLDDAIGEAFDKTARMMGIPYPGGRELDLRASKKITTPAITLPRPMLHSHDLNFSFSGLKTAVLYLIKKQVTPLTEDFKDALSFELQNSIIDVLIKKISMALDQNVVESIIVGGGVIANTHIKKALRELVELKYSHINLYMPEFTYATDNASMIALAGYFKYIDNSESIVAPEDIRTSPKECIRVYSRKDE